MTMSMVSFTDIFTDASGGNTKTLQSDYQEVGELPVVDQGKALIAGYINDHSRVCKSKPPVIVFGDHTCIFKYVDFDFAMGADGTKVLEARDDCDPKYLYYALQSLRFPDVGYSRHYKFLKRVKLPIPPLAEQKRIAGILDAADALRAKRRESIEQLDTLIQSTFVEMFGDPVTNPKGWEQRTIGGIGEVQGGLQVTTKRKDLPIELPYLRVANVHRGRLDLSEIKTIRLTESEEQRTLLQPSDLLIVEGHGNRDEIGRCARWRGTVEKCVHQNHLIRLRCDENVVLAVFVEHFLNSPGGRRYLVGTSRTTSGLNTISVSKVKSAKIYVPSMAHQREFSNAVASIEKDSIVEQRHLAELDTLFASLQSRAFRGEL